MEPGIVSMLCYHIPADHTCHGDVADGHQVGDAHSEQGEGVHGRDEEGDGEDHDGCDDVDQMVGAKDHHQSEKTSFFLVFYKSYTYTCRNICEDIFLRRRQVR